jgi:hypothetical protein
MQRAPINRNQRILVMYEVKLSLMGQLRIHHDSIMDIVQN